LDIYEPFFPAHHSRTSVSLNMQQ